MLSHKLGQKTGKTLMSGLAIAALTALGLPPAPASANSYQTCARNLQAVGITAEAAAAACASMLKPEALSSCVVSIRQQAKFEATDALATCRRVRRPKELASCVVDIQRLGGDVAANDILDSCRRSLLPRQFATCVKGLRQTTKLAPSQAITTCIDGSDQPKDFYPTVQS